LDTILNVLDLDLDPYYQYGSRSGSRGAISKRIHMDPDPKHWHGVTTHSAVSQNHEFVTPLGPISSSGIEHIPNILKPQRHSLKLNCKRVFTENLVIFRE